MLFKGNKVDKAFELEKNGVCEFPLNNAQIGFCGTLGLSNFIAVMRKSEILHKVKPSIQVLRFHFMKYNNKNRNTVKGQSMATSA